MRFFLAADYQTFQIFQTLYCFNICASRYAIFIDKTYQRRNNSISITVSQVCLKFYPSPLSTFSKLFTVNFPFRPQCHAWLPNKGFLSQPPSKTVQFASIRQPWTFAHFFCRNNRPIRLPFDLCSKKTSDLGHYYSISTWHKTTTISQASSLMRWNFVAEVKGTPLQEDLTPLTDPNACRYCHWPNFRFFFLCFKTAGEWCFLSSFQFYLIIKTSEVPCTAPLLDKLDRLSFKERAAFIFWD